MDKISTKLAEQIEKSMVLHTLDVQRVVLHTATNGCRQQLLKRKLNIICELPLIQAYVVELPLRTVPVLATKGFVRYIEHDAQVKINLDTANNTVGAGTVKKQGYTGNGVTVAVIDTGLYPHDDFVLPQNRITYFLDLVNDRPDPYDDNGHGTFCAGCIAGSGYASEGQYEGIAPQANLIMIKALDENGGGSISDVLRAMQWVADNQEKYKIRVLSMSLGIEASDFDPRQNTLSQAAEALWRRGIVVVAAAGNSGPKKGTINSPGTAPSVITVGAVNDRNESMDIAKFSSRGTESMKKPDLVAPGVEVTAAEADTSYKKGDRKKNGYVTLSGTSVATPIVAGAIALMLEKNPQLTPDQVKQLLLKSCVSLQTDVQSQGAGVMHVDKAVEQET